MGQRSFLDEHETASVTSTYLQQIFREHVFILTQYLSIRLTQNAAAESYSRALAALG